jgi:hypothetical protein
MRARIASAVCLAVLIAGVAACSSSDNSSSKNTTTTSNKGFEVQTPDGQVSLSLSGDLPPNGPSDFPVPSGAEPAGSGSLGSSSQTGFVGVYSTSQSPEDAYSFYKSNPGLQVTSASSVGSGNTYLGTVQFTGDFSGTVVIVPYSGETLIVVLLSQSSPGTTGGVSNTTVAP